MKIKKILFFCFIILLFSFSSKHIFANEEEDYLFQQEKYQQDYKNFTTARDKYLKYQTLTAKDEAIKTVKSLINQRNKTLRTYFLALKIKLKTTPGIVNSDQREKLISNLDKEISWLIDQDEQAKSLTNPSLDDLFIISDRFEAKKDIFERLSYQSLTAILLGKTSNLHTKSIAINDLLIDKVNQLEASKSAKFKGWLREVQNENYLSQKQIEEVSSQELLLAKKKGQRLKKIYFTVQTILEKAKGYLKQALSFQEEIYSHFNDGKGI